MIAFKKIKEKSYEEFMEEAISKIPLYSKEWTNYNPSDPGITILENFSAFSALNRQELNQVSQEVRFKLLELAGFFRQKGIPSHCFLSGGSVLSAPVYLPGGQKIYAGEVCFETGEGEELSGTKIFGIYVMIQKRKQNLKALLTEYGIPGGIEIFGEKPRGGEEIYFLFREISSRKTFISFFVEISMNFKRTPFTMEDVKTFASLSWQVYTHQGFVEVKAEDGTCMFLKSGVVKVHIPKEKPQREPESGCYVIRCVLNSASYDIPPKVSRVREIFAEVWQRDTKSAAFLFSGDRHLFLEHYLLKSKDFTVYVEEEPGRFYLWEENTAYRWETVGEYGINLTFFKSPERKQVMIICQEEEMLPWQNLGVLYGYDNQEIILPPFFRVYEEKFSLVIEERGREGRNCYHKVLPESALEGEVFYTLEEESGKIIVKDCGAYEGARVFLGDYCIYQGSEGSVVKGAKFTLNLREEIFELENCMENSGGKFKESIEEVQKRFLLDLQNPCTMVTAEDCEYLVKSTPGLCVDKAGVIAVPKKNEIKLVIKPKSREKCPGLSESYKKLILDFLENYRILNTRISVEGPLYVPIHVHGSVVVKKQYEDCEKTVEQLFYRLLDGTGPDGTFGGVISFHEIYRRVENLFCVEEIRELSLRPGSFGGAVTDGGNICLKENALYFPGELSLDFSRT